MVGCSADLPIHGMERANCLTCTTTAAFSTLATRVEARPDFPNRLVKLIVPVPPGAQLDAVARIVAERLSAKWHQPVIIENRPGAAGSIGAEVVAKAEPDGHTLFVTHPGPLVTNQWLYSKLAYDPSSLVAVTVLVTLPPVLVTNSNLRVSNFSEFLTYARANQGKITYGSPGAGSTPHLAMEELAYTAGLRFIHVPYQGLAPAQRELLGGHIDVMIDMAGNVLPQLSEGKLKVLAVTGDKRLAQLSQVPTVSESVSNCAFTDWFAVAAPPKTPEALANHISRSFADALQDASVAQRMRDFAIVPVGNSPAAAKTFFAQEGRHWRKIIDATRIKVE